MMFNFRKLFLSEHCNSIECLFINDFYSTIDTVLLVEIADTFSNIDLLAVVFLLNYI